MNNKTKSCIWIKASELVDALKKAQEEGRGNNSRDDSERILNDMGLIPKVCKNFEISEKMPDDNTNLKTSELVKKLLDTIIKTTTVDFTDVVSKIVQELKSTPSCFCIINKNSLKPYYKVYSEIPGTEDVLFFQSCYPIYKDSLFALLVKNTLGEDSYKNLWFFCEKESESASHDIKISNKKKDDFEQNMENLLMKHKQIIFTGAPGTGKTYSVRKCISQIIESTSKIPGNNRDQTNDHDSNIRDLNKNRFQFVQFHSSYDYSDFVEGLRPVEINGKNAFVRMDGTFKSFCRKIVEENMQELKYLDNNIENIEILYKIFSSSEDEKYKSDLKKIIMKRPYFFVVDEINRADIGRVFGELMFGLEESYRGVENRFQTQYSNLETYGKFKAQNDKTVYKPINEEKEDVFENGFFIPENLHIVGTMNDIDRSVETFDFALRRRFQWVDIEANKVMEFVLRSMLINDRRNDDADTDAKQIDTDSTVDAYVLSEDELSKLNDRIKALNSFIESGGELGLNSAYDIGPAYLKSFGEGDTEITESSYKNLWEQKLCPILKEYVRGRDPQKIKDFLKKCEQKFSGSSDGFASEINEGSKES